MRGQFWRCHRRRTALANSRVGVVAYDEKCAAAPVGIYEGQRFRGRIRDAFVRGRQVLREDTLLNDAVGHGHYIRRRLLS